MKTNWKTTTTGVIAIVVAVCAAVKALIDNDPTTSLDVGTTIAAITAGVGLILAKDAEKTA
jgi:hypothetical protein